mmetsp:Transcript_41159/g.113473  ORF Transcript_41159/g.113473 Transcript_41159/m.113473 type:complete len:211 (+) Transcript_41159:963-1595(+)
MDAGIQRRQRIVGEPSLGKDNWMRVGDARSASPRRRSELRSRIVCAVVSSCDLALGGEDAAKSIDYAKASARVQRHIALGVESRVQLVQLPFVRRANAETLASGGHEVPQEPAAPRQVSSSRRIEAIVKLPSRTHRLAGLDGLCQSRARRSVQRLRERQQSRRDVRQVRGNSSWVGNSAPEATVHRWRDVVRHPILGSLQLSAARVDVGR